MIQSAARQGVVEPIRFHYELGGRLTLDKMDPKGEDSHQIFIDLGTIFQVE